MMNLNNNIDGRDCVVVEFTTTCATSTYHHVVSSNTIHGEVYWYNIMW